MHINIRAASGVLVCVVVGGFASNRALAQSGANSAEMQIIGTVKTTDGSDVPSGVRIRLVCGASVRIVARTNLSNDFSFRWSGLAPRSQGLAAGSGHTSGTGMFDPLAGLADEGLAMGPGDPDAAVPSCELSADEAEYRSSNIVLTTDSVADSDIGTIWLS